MIYKVMITWLRWLAYLASSMAKCQGKSFTMIIESGCEG